MSFDPVVKNTGTTRVLVVPLDWGLGHATRCIPVIYELLAQGAEVCVAGEGPQEILLKKEFPGLDFFPLKGYRIRYGSSPVGLLTKILFQVPGILRSIRAENAWLKKIVSDQRIDAVISDNRFGLHDDRILSIFITHQLRIKSHLGKLSEWLLQKLNYRYIRRFSACWLPDSPDQLAGELAHPTSLPGIPVESIGILSRLKKSGAPPIPGHLFISLSGPEPQRTILENKIVNQISSYPGTAVIVRGLPAAANILPSTNQIRIYNHLNAAEYNREMEIADFVISRSGYSTIMDIARLGKRAVLIPTPGQPEQEYLGHHLQKKQWALTMRQDQFLLEEALDQARRFNYENFQYPNYSRLAEMVGAMLEKIRQCKSTHTSTRMPDA